MELYTKVAIPKAPFCFSYSDRSLLLGSCFAENMGGRLNENRFETNLNPFGILYNPASIASAVRALIRPERYAEDDLFEHEGVYHSFDHHSRFSSPSREEALENINTRLRESANGLTQATRMVVTFGSAHVYVLKSDGRVVANCHKLPDGFFARRMLSVDEIAEEWTALLHSLWEHNPEIRVLLTVSPVRHRKDGAHGNQLSKAVLLLAADRLCRLFPEQVSYFPAYEIMMDELRDYRFYAEDMLHPSPQAVDYIWERFAESYLSNEAKLILKEWSEIRKALDHKPFHPESEAYKRFIQRTLLRKEQLLSMINSLIVND
jgi:hypothetical protein